MSRKPLIQADSTMMPTTSFLKSFSFPSRPMMMSSQQFEEPKIQEHTMTEAGTI